MLRGKALYSIGQSFTKFQYICDRVFQHVWHVYLEFEGFETMYNYSRVIGDRSAVQPPFRFLQNCDVCQGPKRSRGDEGVDLSVSQDGSPMSSHRPNIEKILSRLRLVDITGVI